MIKLHLTFTSLLYQVIIFSQLPIMTDNSGHTHSVYSVKFSNNEKKIVTAGADNIAFVWDFPSKKKIFELLGHSGSVNSAVFSPNDSLIATCSSDGLVKIWDSQNGSLIGNLKGHSSSVYSVIFSNSGKEILTASHDNKCILWDLKYYLPRFSLTGSKSIFSPDNKVIVTLSNDNNAHIWDSDTGRLKGNLIGHEKKITSVDFSSNGKYIITGSEDNKVILWDSESLKIINQIDYHSDAIINVIFSPDDKFILTMSKDESALIVDALSLNILHIIKDHSDITEAIFSNDSKFLIIGYQYGELKTWNCNSGKLVKSFFGHVSGITTLCRSNDSKVFISGSHDKTFKIWDTNTSELIADFSMHNQDAIPSLVNNENHLIVLSSNFVAKNLDLLSGQISNLVKNETASKYSSFISPSSNKIVINNWEKGIEIWDLNRQNLMSTLETQSTWLMYSCFSKDEENVLTIPWLGIPEIHSCKNGKLISSIKSDELIEAACFSNNGYELITGSNTGKLTFWNIQNGKPIRSLQCSLISNIETILLSNTGKYLAVGSISGYISVWDLSLGVELFTSNSHNERINNFNFSEDELILFSTSHDNSIKIWDISLKKIIQTIKLKDRIVPYLISEKINMFFAIEFRRNIIYAYYLNNSKLRFKLLFLSNQDYLVSDSFNRYDGTPNAINQLHVVCGDEIIDLDQLKEELYVPNLVERLMRGDSIYNKKLSDLDICELMPKVNEIEDSDTNYIKYKIIPRRGGLGKTEIYINEKGVVQTIESQDLRKKGNDFELWISKKEYQDKNYFIPGEENTITVKSYIKANNISSRGSIVIMKDHRVKLPPPNVYAIFIGVNDYKGDGLDLKYASADAQTLSTTFTSSSNKFFSTSSDKNNVFTYNLCDLACETGIPEKKLIEKVIKEVGDKTKPNDVVFIFFAGHGQAGKGDDKNFYFLTSDASPHLVEFNLGSVSISSTELKQWVAIDRMKAQKLVLVFDACQASQLISAFNDKDYAFRNETKEEEKKILEFERMNDKAGMYLLTSSAPSQSSYELDKYGHGLLTYAMLKTIKENTNITDQNDYLSINKWFDESIKTLEEIARKENIQQKPDKRTGSDFPIGIVDDEVRKSVDLGEEKVTIGRTFFNEPVFTEIFEQTLETKVENSAFLFNKNRNDKSSYVFGGSYQNINGLHKCELKVFFQGNVLHIIVEENYELNKLVDTLIEQGLNTIKK